MMSGRFLAPPYSFETVASDVDLESANAVSGASWYPGDGDFERIANAKGKWILARPSEPVVKILEAGLGSILYVDEPSKLLDLKLPENANESNLMIALQTSGITSEADAEAMISPLRSQFPNTRIILSVGIEFNKNAPGLARLPSSDGTIFLDVFAGNVAEFVRQHLL